MLYRGDWDGLSEGPTWNGWWTQNSYGPTMTALPLMDDFTLAATKHSYAFWFNSIGNGTRRGADAAHDGGLAAPDGCLCDNAVPVPPGNGEGCNYKQARDGKGKKKKKKKKKSTDLCCRRESKPRARLHVPPQPRIFPHTARLPF